MSAWRRRRAVGEEHEDAVRAVGDVADAGGDARPGLAGLGAGDGRGAEGQALAAEREDDDGVGGRAGGVDLARRRAADEREARGDLGDRADEDRKVVGPAGEDEQQPRVVVPEQRGLGRLEPGHGWIGVGGPADGSPAAATGTRHPWIGTLHTRGHRLRGAPVEAARGAASGRRLRTVDPGESVERRSAVGRFGPAALLAVLLLATLVGTVLTADRVEDREQQELGDRARATTEAIGRRMETYAQILRGAAGALPGQRRRHAAGLPALRHRPGPRTALSRDRGRRPRAGAGARRDRSLRACHRPCGRRERPALPGAPARPSASRARHAARPGRRPARARLAAVGRLRPRPTDRPRSRARHPARRGDRPAGGQRATAPVPPAGLVAGRGARRAGHHPGRRPAAGRRLRGLRHGPAAARRPRPARPRCPPRDLRRRAGAVGRARRHHRPARHGLRPAGREGAA